MSRSGRAHCVRWVARLSRWFESTPSVGSQASFSLGCQPGSFESAPLVAWSVLGSPSLLHGPPLHGAGSH